MIISERSTEYESYREFFDDLINEDGLSKRVYDNDSYIYRGESTSKYRLIPNVLRSECHEKLLAYSPRFVYAGSSKDYTTSERWVIEKEYAALAKFYKYANNQGLRIPHISHLQKTIAGGASNSEYFRRNFSDFAWYDDEMASLASLAQHYGCLTRMLDWTQDIFVALYFASHGALQRNDKQPLEENDSMVIWMLNTHKLGFMRTMDRMYPLIEITPPYSDNPNLCSQKGVLTYWRIYADKLTDLSRVQRDQTPLDELISQHKTQLDDGIPTIYQLKIPAKECIGAYMHMDGFGYNSAHMFPGYKGVVMKMEDDILLERLISNQKRKQTPATNSNVTAYH